VIFGRKCEYILPGVNGRSCGNQDTQGVLGNGKLPLDSGPSRKKT
jgi:hypothetical protein